MSQFPPPLPVSGQQQQPHRATLVFVLGLLGILLCFICGIVAWVMGNRDLKEMKAGRMDPSGMGLTQAGWILGIISSILGCIAVCGMIAYFLFAMVIVGAAAAGGAGGPGGGPTP